MTDVGSLTGIGDDRAMILEADGVHMLFGFGPQKNARPPEKRMRQVMADPGIRVSAIRSHLLQKNDLPDGTPILGTVTGSRLDPIAIGILRVEDDGYRTGTHHCIPSSDHFGVIGGSIE